MSIRKCQSGSDETSLNISVGRGGSPNRPRAIEVNRPYLVMPDNS